MSKKLSSWKMLWRTMLLKAKLISLLVMVQVLNSEILLMLKKATNRYFAFAIK